MANNLRKLGIVVTLTGVILLALVVLATTYPEVGITELAWAGEAPALSPDFASVPQRVTEDAIKTGRELFGSSQGKYLTFADQLLRSYQETTSYDVVLIFNQGGWGLTAADKSPGWTSILEGINGELDGLGYKSLALNYRRTSQSLLGRVKETIELMTDAPTKADNLAKRVEFLTTHIPDLRVILAGESNGAIIADAAMRILRDNRQVYAIETGSPPWHKPLESERTLILNSNGTGPDTFSQGNIPAMAWVTIKYWLGLSSPDEGVGRVLFYINAPGHDYSWQYPEVYAKITGFLESNFGLRVLNY